jgi:predicted nucleic acid-binding protein
LITVYLVDTHVISASVAPSELVTWMDAHSASLFLSAVTVAEIEDGTAKLQREGATRKSEDLAAWLETVLHLYGDRVLAFDRPTARIADACQTGRVGKVMRRAEPTSSSRRRRNIQRSASIRAD